MALLSPRPATLVCTSRAYDNHKYHQDGCTGFLMMKFVLQQNTDRSQPQHWPFMRFAEVLLNCAEAYNEADGGPSDKAYAWVNAVRARVGLPGLPEGLSQEEFRKALILEREGVHHAAEGPDVLR